MIDTAPGILPRGDTRVTGEDATWHVKPTWKGAQKSGSDGGLAPNHQINPTRGWPHGYIFEQENLK
jgi:hypothetical protein